MDEPSPATTRQAQMILANNPTALDRLIQDTPRRALWLLRQRAIFDRMVVTELRIDAKAAMRIKR